MLNFYFILSIILARDGIYGIIPFGNITLKNVYIMNSDTQSYILNFESAKSLNLQNFICTIGTFKFQENKLRGGCFKSSNILLRIFENFKIMDCVSNILSYGIEFIDSPEFLEKEFYFKDINNLTLVLFFFTIIFHFHNI